jgi:Rrf2 family protein
VNLGKSSRYALLAAIEMAMAGDRLVAASDVARRHGVPEAVVSKVLQRLVRGGIVVGTRGNHGGYRLAKESSRVTVLDILGVFDNDLGHRPKRRRRASAPASSEPLDRLMAEVTEVVRYTFASVSIETLKR